VDGAARGFGPAAAATGTVEGLTTALALRDLSYRLGIELPITEGVCKVLDGTDSNQPAASQLGREPTRE
jgi:glycerol-3-phosphate dehydrogenase